MGYALVILLVLIGVGTLFITPWVGAGFILLALIAAIVVLGGTLLGIGTRCATGPSTPVSRVRAILAAASTPARGNCRTGEAQGRPHRLRSDP